MADIVAIPFLEVEEPHLRAEPPFHWKSIGPLEYLFDRHGRRVFRGLVAIHRPRGEGSIFRDARVPR